MIDMIYIICIIVLVICFLKYDYGYSFFDIRLNTGAPYMAKYYILTDIR